MIRFDGGGTKPRVITRKNLAYPEPSPVQLTVGARVIAQYIEDKGDGKPRPALFYAGIIAEPPKYLNEYRYLVFFDDGYAQYCTHEQVLVVCNSSKDVWQDIHLNTRSFIMNYLQQFPERAMVKLQKGQTVKTELNGRWLLGRVDLVDASLAKIFFIPDGRHEWIYRGSTRLWPLYELMANAEARKNQGATRPAHNLSNIHKKKNAPYVEYTRGLDTEPPKLPLAPPQPAVPSSAAASPSTQVNSLPQQMREQVNRINLFRMLCELLRVRAPINRRANQSDQQLIHQHHHRVWSRRTRTSAPNIRVSSSSKRMIRTKKCLSSLTSVAKSAWNAFPFKRAISKVKHFFKK